jgi:multiple sugar transport system substrate-binding protein
MRNMISRREFLKAAVLTSAASTLAACAPAATPVPTSAPAQATTAPTVAMPLKGTSIKVLYSDLNYWPFIQKYLPDFEKQTGIKVTIDMVSFSNALTQIETELSSGSTAYDSVMNIFIKAQRWMRAGWLSPIDDFVARDKVDISDFLPALVDAHKLDNKLYAVPFASEVTLMLYRKDILDGAGLKPPTTFAELGDALAKTQKLPDFYSYVMRTIPAGVHFPYPIWLQGYGGNIFRDPPNDVTPSLNTPAALEAATNFTDLIMKYSIGGGQIFNEGDCQNSLTQGKAGLWIDALGIFGPVLDPTKSQISDKFAIAMPPGGPKGTFPQIASHALAIPKAAKNKEAAWEFIKWSTSMEMLLKGALESTWSTNPRKSVLTNPEFSKKYSVAGVNRGELVSKSLEIAKCAYRVEPEFSEIGARVGQAIGEIISKQKSVKDAMDAAQKDAVAVMKNAGRKISE